MDRPLPIRRLDIERSQALYGQLKHSVPEYLERCGLECSAQFSVWAVNDSVHWCPLDGGGVMLEQWRPRLSVRLHPVVWGRKLATDRVYMREVLSGLLKTCIVERLEALVPIEAPSGVHRWCERAGFEREGTLRRAAQWRGRVSDGVMYSYTEAR